ncbi:hypothetical protein L1049_000107 [Liquidambar formosana]|uniref:Uncharacterized protein n=1 Tax=Liquidambar formosana TaxID=63359 RepID=A0AAP0N959_LIQFO
MNNQKNQKRDEIVAAAIAACTAGILSMVALYLEHAEDLETNDQVTSLDEDVELDDINEGMEASSKQLRPTTSTYSKPHVKKPCSTNRIAKTMSTMAANLSKLAQVLDQSSDEVSVDELYEKVMKVEGFDSEFLVEAFEYIYSDDKKARTFLSLNGRQRKIWLLKYLHSRNG